MIVFLTQLLQWSRRQDDQKVLDKSEDNLIFIFYFDVNYQWQIDQSEFLRFT